MNEVSDLIDDGNTSKVFDSTGKEVYSGSTGRQGSLEASSSSISGINSTSTSWGVAAGDKLPKNAGEKFPLLGI